MNAPNVGNGGPCAANLAKPNWYRPALGSLGRIGYKSSDAGASTAPVAVSVTTPGPRSPDTYGVLAEAGLVHVRLRGRERVYRLDTEPMEVTARSWLDRFTGQGGVRGECQ